MSLSIFISYRREDSAPESMMLYKDLVQSFGKEFVFMDSHNIDLGAKWPDEIRESLAAAETVIVVIGQKWLTMSDEYGRRRIDKKDDWVRQEIDFAIANDKTIIPCIITPAQRPPEEALPDSIKKLPDFKEIEIRKNYWDSDIELLIARLTGKNQMGTTQANARQVEIDRPEISPLPLLPRDHPILTSFVGRDGLIGSVRDALRGLQLRANGKPVISFSEKVQLFWLHGFGGMGKTWFLRKCCLVAKDLFPDVYVALIDWDDPIWREPISSRPPSRPEDLFDVIAYRLAQLSEITELDDYWKARKAIKKNATKRREMEFFYDNALGAISYEFDQLALGKQAFQPAGNGDFLVNQPREQLLQIHTLRKLLLRQKIIQSDPASNTKRLRLLMANQIKRNELFEVWAEEILGDNSENSITRPAQLLADILKKIIRRLCATTPMFLVIDTCELLSEELDRWLRILLSDLISTGVPVLVLVGSRLKPDSHLDYGIANTWLQQVESEKRTIVPFDEGVRFTLEEVEKSLSMTVPPIGPDPELVRILHRMTRGVPLAVRIILDLHESKSTVLSELTTLEEGIDYDLEETHVMQKVVEALANRLLLHLLNNPAVLEELKYIIAMALQSRIEPTVLAKLWNVSNVSEIIRPLSKKYSFIATGDLHPTVREFLQRHWRFDPILGLEEVLNAMEKALNELEPSGRKSDRNYFDWEIERLNIKGWMNSDAAIKDAERLYVVGLAYEHPIKEISNIVQELQKYSDNRRLDRRRMYAWLTQDRMDWRSPEFAKLLEAVDVSGWSSVEKATKDLLIGLALSDWNESNLDAKKEHTKATHYFKKALLVLRGDYPRKHEVITRYFRSIYYISMDGTNREIVTEGYDWAINQGLSAESYALEYGNLLHNLGRYEESVAHYVQARENDPESLWAHVGLIHTYHHHLKRHEETLSACDELLESDIDGYNEASLFQFKAEALVGLKRFREAEKVYRKNLELYEGLELKLRLVNLLQDQLNRPEEAVELLDTIMDYELDDINDVVKLLNCYSKIGKATKEQRLLDRVQSMAKEIKESVPLNSAAWKIYESDKYLKVAKYIATLANEKEDATIHSLHTLVAIQIRLGEWESCKEKYEIWINKVDSKDIESGWSQFVLMFTDLKEQGLCAEAGTLIGPREPLAFWEPLRWALENSCERVSAHQQQLPHQYQTRANKIIAQMYDNMSVAEKSFPSIE